jgi:arginyl-tRNA synthetase
MKTEKKTISEVSRYISRDFEKNGINALISGSDFSDLEEFKGYLTEKIRDMMETKFEKLINTLYLIDISEDKLNELFKADNRDTIPSKLAELIIERQLQKYYLRERYRRGEL